MGILRGIETLALGKTKTVELHYAGAGRFEDADDKEVKVLDIACLECGNSFYGLASDPIDFCPHCGDRRGKTWKDYAAARGWAQKHDFQWLRDLGRQPIGIQLGGGAWALGLARDAAQLMERVGYVKGAQVLSARELLIDDREVAAIDGGVGAAGGGGGPGVLSAFGGGGDEWGGGLEID